MGIPDPRLSAESAYNTSKASSGELADSLLGVSALNYVVHRACVRPESLAARREKMHVNLGELARQKDLAGGREKIASIGQQLIGHGLALYPIALTALISIERNSGIIFASDKG